MATKAEERIPLGASWNPIRTFGPTTRSPFEELVMGDLVNQAGPTRPLRVPKISFVSPSSMQGGGGFGGGTPAAAAGGAAAGANLMQNLQPASGAAPTTTTTTTPASAGASPYAGLVNPVIKAGQKAWSQFGPGPQPEQLAGPPPEGYQGDIIGGGLSTLSGLMQLYQATQGGGVGPGLAGGASLLSGLGKLAPETTAALSNALGLGTQGLGLATSGLGGLAGGYGLYQGIKQGDPLQAIQGGAGIYTGLAPLVNYFAGQTILPTLSSLGSSAISALSGTAIGNALGIAAPAATSAATTAAGAGAGAAAGGLGAGLTAGIFALPMVAAYLGVTIDDMVSAEAAMRRERARQQRFQRGLPTMAEDLSRGADLMSTLTPQASNEQLMDTYNKLITAQRNWEGGPATGNPLAPSFPAMIGGMSDAGRATQEQLAPYLAQISLAQLRAQDLMEQRGLALPTGATRMTPEIAAKLLGGASSAYDPESGSFLGMPNYLSTNPWIQKNLLEPSRQRYELARDVQSQAYGPGGEAIRDISTFDPGIQAQLAGLDLSRAPDPRTTFAWSPEAQEAFKGIQPGGMEASIRKLLGLPAATYGSATPVETERYGALNIPTFGKYGTASTSTESGSLVPGTPGNPLGAQPATGSTPQMLANPFSGGISGLLKAAAPQMADYFKPSPLLGGFA